jgi:hypothetical protein
MNPIALQAQWILGGPESPCYDENIHFWKWLWPANDTVIGAQSETRSLDQTKKPKRTLIRCEMKDIPFLGLFRGRCSPLILEVPANNHEIF